MVRARKNSATVEVRDLVPDNPQAACKGVLSEGCSVAAKPPQGTHHLAHAFRDRTHDSSLVLIAPLGHFLAQVSPESPCGAIVVPEQAQAFQIGSLVLEHVGGRNAPVASRLAVPQRLAEGRRAWLDLPAWLAGVEVPPAP